MDTPYGIFEYNIDNLCVYISYQTNTPLGQIKQKKQIIYLINYLDYFVKNNSGNGLAFVYENDYIDKHYLEDYSSYYVRCFENYRKTCSRIHFFKKNESEVDLKSEFKKALNNQKSFINNENYLGYIVIRPIPQTFLANICLEPYYQDQERYKNFMLLQQYKVSLFGMNLSVDSIAFQEQDKVLSACATTSLWSFFHAYSKMCKLSLPSSSDITKSAYPENNGHYREFPNSGLSTEMICRSLRAYDVVPEYFEFSNENEKDKDIKLNNTTRIELLKEYIFSYCSSGLPLILGVTVKDSGESENKGLHAVTILGYALNSFNQDDSIAFVAHRLKNIYVHDDRFGAFLKIDFEGEKLKVHIEHNEAFTNNKIDDEVYLPDTLTIGLYHKIRIPYLSIKNTCINLVDLFSAYLDDIKLQDEANYIREFTWDIQLKEISKLKNKILLNDKITDTDKEDLLTKSWPKYIWSAVAKVNDEDVIELLFDATDIDQGNVFLDIIALNDDNASDLIDTLKGYCDLSFNHKIVTNDYLQKEQESYIWGIINFFRKKDSYKKGLSELFGYLKIPAYLKSNETDTNNEIVNHCDVRTNQECSTYKLDIKIKEKNATYLWVIDQDGYLCIGKEYHDNKQGHPTLTDGMPARIGGELKYNDKETLWEINCFSGRYSKEYDYDYETKVKYIENALKYKFKISFPNENFKIECPPPKS